MTLRFRLAELLERRGLSQAELVRLSGVSQRTVTRLCGNQTGQVSLAILERLATALGVDPGDLIAGPGKRRKR